MSRGKITPEFLGPEDTGDGNEELFNANRRVSISGIDPVMRVNGQLDSSVPTSYFESMPSDVQDIVKRRQRSKEKVLWAENPPRTVDDTRPALTAGGVLILILIGGSIWIAFCVPLAIYLLAVTLYSIYIGIWVALVIFLVIIVALLLITLTLWGVLPLVAAGILLQRVYTVHYVLTNQRLFIIHRSPIPWCNIGHTLKIVTPAEWGSIGVEIGEHRGSVIFSKLSRKYGRSSLAGPSNILQSETVGEMCQQVQHFYLLHKHDRKGESIASSSRGSVTSVALAINNTTNTHTHAASLQSLAQSPNASATKRKDSQPLPQLVGSSTEELPEFDDDQPANVL
jgi:hypothetical protein